MGQGNIKYRKVKRTPQTGENAGKELWYATVVTDREMNFEEFVDHISSHNSPYSRGTVHGVMMDMLDCLKELILDGKSVRLGDLGLFSIGMSSRGEVSKDKVTSASVEGIHLLVKNTKNWSNSELKKLCKITAYDARGGEETDGGTTGGGTNGGGSDNTQGSGGTSGGNTSQGGGTDQGTTGGGDKGDKGDGDSTDVTI
jgi:predicted histone-like DNA-binding protein